MPTQFANGKRHVLEKPQHFIQPDLRCVATLYFHRYDLVPGLGYYMLHTDVKTWDEALHVCEQEGAHLAIINSEEDVKALSPFWDANPKILDGAPNDWAHAGFHDKYKKGQYLTIFNETLIVEGYVKCYPDDPHDVGQNYGVVVRRNHLLTNVGRTANLPSFCEKEI